MITLSEAGFGFCFEAIDDAGERIFVQSDWDYPSLARLFGWNMIGDSCAHDSTDGTVDCRDCGKKAIDFLASAHDFLLRHDGLTVEGFL